MRILAAGLAAGMAAMLVGCAVPEQKADGELLAAGSVAADHGAGRDEEPLTGSRIGKRTSTDRMLKSVSAQGARDAMQEAPRPLKTE